MPKRFVVHITDIRSRPGGRVPAEVAGEIEGLAVSGSSVPPGSKTSFKGVIEAMEAGTGVVANGMVTANWEGSCRRCLKPASGSMAERVSEIFELDPVEGETYRLERDEVDLEPLIREIVVLNLPEAPLCTNDCAGLCPQCGTDWNSASCDCKPDTRDPRWSVLDQLKD